MSLATTVSIVSLRPQTKTIEESVKKALTDFTGANHKPILELGEQIVKGKDYHFICKSKGDCPDAEPYLTRVAINNFQDNWTIDQIVKL